MNSTQVNYLFIRLLNFKIDNTSIRLFDGVDYTEMKKKREQELKELMLNEMSVSISRRSKRNIQSTDDPNETPNETPNHSRIIHLPAMYNFQVCYLIIFSHLLVLSKRTYIRISYNCSTEL